MSISVIKNAVFLQITSYISLGIQTTYIVTISKEGFIKMVFMIPRAGVLVASIGQNLQTFAGNCDVSKSVKKILDCDGKLQTN